MSETKKIRKIYAASSWRNELQPAIVKQLRDEGHEVYDFRHPKSGDAGFSWSEIDEEWQTWNPRVFRSALDHVFSMRGFSNDWQAMCWADTGLLILPSGRSAHIEAGYFVGAHKKLIIYIPQAVEPELMYKMADHICLTMEEVLEALQKENYGS